MIKQHGNQAGQKQITLWLFYGMVTAIMWGLKQHYSNAVADDLMWILNPVAAIVEAVDGLAYTWQVGVGWVRSDGFIIIAKSCAGVNFMIMLFGLSTIAFLHRLKDLRWQLLWLIVVMLAAYAISIGINSLRIMISIILYENHWSWQWFTPERLHRVLGVAVYFPVLGLYYLLLDRIMDKLNKRRFIGWLPATKVPLLLPFCWYVIGTVLIPFLHAALKGHPRLNLEHCLTVIGASALLWLAGVIGWQFMKKEKSCDP